MKEYLWKKFVKDYENYKDPEVRDRYTRLTGTLGILTNSFLCVVKIILGIAINSIAVIADGAHDMADSVAALITLIGARIARKPADKDHPYGHARVEYLASLVVSAIILIVGFELLKNSNVDKLILSGKYAYDMAVRVEMANLSNLEVIVEPDLDRMGQLLKVPAEKLYAITCFSDKEKLFGQVQVQSPTAK